MITISLAGGYTYTTDMSYDSMINVVSDMFVNEDTFVSIIADNESRVAIRKGSIVAVEEVEIEV